MATTTRLLRKHNLPAPLALEADRLALQLEQALKDPLASAEVFFQALDRYSNVLKVLEQQRARPALTLVKP